MAVPNNAPTRIIVVSSASGIMVLLALAALGPLMNALTTQMLLILASGCLVLGHILSFRRAGITRHSMFTWFAMAGDATRASQWTKGATGAPDVSRWLQWAWILGLLAAMSLFLVPAMQGSASTALPWMFAGVAAAAIGFTATLTPWLHWATVQTT